MSTSPENAPEPTEKQLHTDLLRTSQRAVYLCSTLAGKTHNDIKTRERDVVRIRNRLEEYSIFSRVCQTSRTHIGRMPRALNEQEAAQETSENLDSDAA